MNRPLIIVDIDGVLNPWPYQRPAGLLAGRVRWTDRRQVRVNYNPAHGRMLTGLAERHDAELVWGTMWQADANRFGRLVGLQLPVIPISRTGLRSYDMGEYKARSIVPWTGGRPFVWFDDEADAAEAATRLAEPGQLFRVVTVDDGTGLTEADVAEADRFLSGLRAGSTA